jgi:hypothetical protein
MSVKITDGYVIHPSDVTPKFPDCKTSNATMKNLDTPISSKNIIINFLHYITSPYPDEQQTQCIHNQPVQLPQAAQNLYPVVPFA